MPQSSVNYRNYQPKYWQVPLYVAFFHTDLSWLCIDCWQHLQMWFPLVQKAMFLWDSHYCLTRFYSITYCDVCGNDAAFAESAMRNSMTCLQAIRTSLCSFNNLVLFSKSNFLKRLQCHNWCSPSHQGHLTSLVASTLSKALFAAATLYFLGKTRKVIFLWLSFLASICCPKKLLALQAAWPNNFLSSEKLEHPVASFFEILKQSLP